MVRDGKLKAGMFWSFIGSYGNKLVSTIVFFLLAKLLGADQFGLVAISNAIINIGDIIIEQGMVSAIVQKQNPKPSYINTAFLVNIILGLVIFCVVFFSAPVIAELYKEPRLNDIIRVASLVYLIGPCGIVQTAILTKQMNFRGLTISRTFGLAVGGGLAIGLAFRGMGAWSLVAQQLASVTMITLIMWKQSNWRPSFNFSRKSFAEIFSFSSKMLGNNFINYFNTNSTELIIGLYLNAHAVGLYLFAYKIFHTTIVIANTSINQVILPLFATVQNDDTTLTKYFLQAIKTAYYILLPILMFVIFIVPLIIELFFNSSWHKGIYLIPLVCIAGILNMICYYSNSLLISKNRLDLLIKSNFVNGALNIILVYFAAHISLEFVGLSQILKNIIILPVTYYFLSQVIHIRLKDISKSLVNQLLIAFALAVIMYSISYVDFINDLNLNLILIIKSLIFGFSLLASFIIIAPDVTLATKQLISGVYKNRKSKLAIRSQEDKISI